MRGSERHVQQVSRLAWRHIDDSGLRFVLGSASEDGSVRVTSIAV